MNYHCQQSSDCPPVDTQGHAVPIATLRMEGTGTPWNVLETCAATSASPSDPCFNWNLLDADLQKKMAIPGIVDIEMTFQGTPTFAQGSCTSGTKCPPSDVNTDGSGTDQYWINFITAFHTRYGPSSTSCGKASPNCFIKFYEVWNEANPGSGSQYFVGTNSQLVRMAYDVYQIVHPDGQSLVLSPSMTGGSGESTFFKSYLPATEAAHGTTGAQNCDILAFHGRQGPSRTPNNTVPEAIADVLNSIVPVFNNPTYGAVGKPYWNTEAGWRGSSAPSGAELNDVNVEAAYVARYHLIQASLALASGGTASVGRVYWFNWDVMDCWGALYAVSGDLTTCWTNQPAVGPTVAATAYTQVMNWIVGSTFTQPCQKNTSTGTWTCAFTEANGTPALAVWNPNGSVSYTLPTTASNGGSITYAQYLDLTGNVTTVTGGTVTVGTSPLLLEATGGSSGNSKPHPPTAVQAVAH